MNKLTIVKIIIYDDSDNSADTIEDVTINILENQLERFREELKRKHNKKISFVYYA
jgi:hypothetical protein